MNGKVMEAKDIGGVLWLRASDVSEEIARVRSDTKTLRDYFAAHAPEPPVWWHGGDQSLHNMIAWKWRYADAMLSDRETS